MTKTKAARKIKRLHHSKGPYIFHLFIAFLLFFFIGLKAEKSLIAASPSNADTTAPTVLNIVPSSGLVITDGQSIQLTFNETLDPASLTLSGNMAPESNGGVFSASPVPTDGSPRQSRLLHNILTVRPQSTWGYGFDRTLSIGIHDIAGNPLETVHLTFTILQGNVYVASPKNGGDDQQSGTKNAPKATIQEGIKAAAEFFPGGVLVSGGIYPVDSSRSTHILLKEGISIFGGFSHDFNIRNPAVNTTAIKDKSTADGTFKSPNRAVEAGNGITRSTVVDGFTIQGGKGNFSSGIFNHDGASPRIQNNLIEGGKGRFSIAIFNFISSSPIIQNNIIDGKSGTGRSYGIYNKRSSSPIIQKNVIKGGQGSVSYGVYNITSSSPIIRDNTITGGGGGINSYGIYNSNASPIIRNNDIDGGSSSNNAHGIYNLLSSSPIIQNNAIKGGRGDSHSRGISNFDASPIIQNNTIDGGNGGKFSYGIHNHSVLFPSSPIIQNNFIFTSGNGSHRGCIFNSNAQPLSVQNNDLFDCPTALYRDKSGINLLTIEEVNNLPGATASNNVSIDPVFVNRNGKDWRLTIASPSDVTQGGLDLSDDLLTDFNSNSRTLPWSIGAYELD